MKIKIHPLSVNQCWQGRRFKTPLYESYEREMIYSLPSIKIPTGKLKLSLVFGFSSKLSDIDNGIKPLLDILQKKYNFNDKIIYQLNVKKVDTKKGEEYIEFEVKKLSTS